MEITPISTYEHLVSARSAVYIDDRLLRSLLYGLGDDVMWGKKCEMPKRCRAKLQVAKYDFRGNDSVILKISN